LETLEKEAHPVLFSLNPSSYSLHRFGYLSPPLTFKTLAAM